MATPSRASFSSRRCARPGSVIRADSVTSSSSSAAGHRGQALVEQVAGGEVHRDRQRPTGVRPRPDLAQGTVQDVAGERPDQAGVLGQRDEVIRWDQAAVGVLPADQGLGADDVPGADADLGLVVQDQLVAVQRPAQVPEQRQLRRGVAVDGRVVGEHPQVLALRDVHGDVGALQQGGGVRAVLPGQHDPDAGLDVQVEASVGVVLSGEHGADATTLQQRADIAMYVAKSQNLGVFAYDPAVDGHSPAKLALLGDLRRALDRNELVLHYQPKVSISTGDVIGAEALVRWQHPDRGLVPPDDFIPLAEHTGLIGPLTRYVLDSALGQIRAWADAGRPLTVAVNLSARNLLDERLPAMVAELLTVHGVPAALLELEVTESALMTEPGRAQRLLERLARLGVAISVDDFGAGYTSLGQLKDLPVRELKVDRSFVTTMTQDRSNALIVHSVVDLGHNLGLTIVAEGVE